MEFVIAAVSSQFHIVPHEPTTMQNPSAVTCFLESSLKFLKWLIHLPSYPIIWDSFLYL